MRGKANLASWLLCVLFLTIPAQAQYGGGDGTAANPYLIYTAEQMNAIGAEPNDWNKHFKLMADIDLRSLGTAFNNIGTTWDRPFSGVFDGDGHAISNFECNNPDVNSIGLFGYLWGENVQIKNLRLIDPVIYAETKDWVGTLIGQIYSGTVTACSVENGTVWGKNGVGGLIGFNYGFISQCYSTATVLGTTGVGGLIGENGGIITNCYSTGSISGNEKVGGLVGQGHYTNSIINCYSTARVSGINSVGGLVGTTNITKWSFWDIETSGQTDSGGGTGLTTAELQTASTFYSWGGCDGIWTIDEGNDYPRLWWQNMPGEPIVKPGYIEGNGTESDPYLIYTAEQLNMIGLFSCDWDKHFKLMADIDLSEYTGTEFNIIGYRTGRNSAYDEPFTGVFDGNGRKISNFNYSSTEPELYIAIFGYTKYATLENIYLIDPNINVEKGTYVGSLVGWSEYGNISACHVQGGNVWGASEVGGLAGHNRTIITECASLTTVMGGSRIGGLVGSHYYVTISHCYSLSNVTGAASVGGLVGTCGPRATITYCFSAGRVQGEEDTGGLLGFTDQGEISHSFWDIEASGQMNSAGGEGKTTIEMQTASTFIGWGPYAVWTINEGLEYPRLLWENMPGELLTTTLFPSIEGSGTQNDPYLIYTAEQFNLIGLFPLEWDKHFELMADIDLAGYTATTFNVIGSLALYPASGDIPFSGAFDGNGHTISNFNYTGISGGVFGWVKGAEIKNLTLIDPNVNSMPGGIHIGSLVGYLYDATVENCHVKGGQVSGGFRVGGLIGENYYGTINNCSFKGIVSNASGLGGLVGWNRGTITNSYFTGEVSGEGQEVGGLVGFNTDTINNCEALANVSGTRKVGGLVGTQTGGRITDCYAAGSVTGRDEVGGFIGGNNGIIDSCCTISDVTGQIDVGGFDGQNGLNLTDVVWRGRISNCYARGNIVGEENVGGLVGYNYGFGTINNCYSTGVVSGVIEEGGLVGQNDYGDVFNSFWDIETSGLSTSAAGSGKTTAQMQDSNMYISSGWIFTELTDGPNYNWAKLIGGGYPILWWQLSPLPELPFFSGGTGKPNDPYLITTAEELNMIGHNPRLMNAHFKLVADIDLANVDFFMIGNDSFPFSGVFDGNGKRIFNFSYIVQEISMSPIDDNSVGLFKYILGGRIKNLGIIDPNIDSLKSEWLGTLVSWLSEGKVTSCYVQGGSISASDYVGGLVAKNFGIITNCHTDITVKGGYSVGGLIGDNIGDVSDCYSNSILLGERNTGGLVGNNSGQIFNCYSKGNVSASYIVGGLVGYNQYDGEIICCYANGSVTGGSSIGGLVGYNNGFSTPAKISNCYATGIITGADNVGGLVAYNKFGIVSNCYSTSIVFGNDNVGGLVGRLGPGDVSQCYATGTVSGTTDTGGLVGVKEGGSVYYSFWDLQTSQQSTSIGGMGMTTVEMQTASTFLEAGWDFVDETENGTDDIWWILEGQDYPRLWWEATENELLDN